MIRKDMRVDLKKIKNKWIYISALMFSKDNVVEFDDYSILCCINNLSVSGIQFSSSLNFPTNAKFKIVINSNDFYQPTFIFSLLRKEKDGDQYVYSGKFINIVEVDKKALEKYIIGCIVQSRKKGSHQRIVKDGPCE